MTVIYALCSILLLPIITYGEVIQTELPFNVPLCSKGPSIWCQNVTNAIECKAVKHCIQTVWTVSSSLDESDDGCSICVDTLSKIKKGVNATVTKEVIEEVLDSVCDLTILTSVLRKQCERAIHKYVDVHINEFLNFINSGMSPMAMCKTMGLCGLIKPIAPKEVHAPSEEVEIKYNNIVLHFPANNFNLIDIIKPAKIDFTQPKRDPLFGSNKCTWGPAYFCSNLNSSRECSSTKTCIEHYWNKDYPEDDDSVCQVCKDMVKQARDQLLSNETQEELKEVFEGSCKLIPIKDVKGECIKLVDQFIPELTDMLASQMNPTAVCTIAGLCNSKRIDELIKSSISETSSYDFSGYDACSNCSAAYSRYRNYIQNNDKFDLANRLNSFCGELSTYSDACVLFVNENIESIFEFLNNQVNYFTLCHNSGMCSQDYHTHQDTNAQQITYRGEVDPMVVAQDDDLPCDLCKQLVTHLKQVLVANTTESEFREMLLGICAQTGKFKSECVSLVEDKFEIIYKFLTDEISPEDFCEAIQICPKPRTLLTDVRVNTLLTSSVMLNRDAEIIEVVSSSPAITETTVAVAEDLNANDVECRLCVFFISQGEKLLQEPKYAKDVKSMLNDLCNVVPASEKNKCNEFINKYAQTLINLMITETDPKVVCSLMAVCPTQTLPSGAKNLCPICSAVLHFIQNELDSPKEKEKIINTMKRACNVMPSNTRNECMEFVNEYTEYIVSILSQEVDPSVVCPALKLCPNFMPTGKRCNTCRVLMTNMIDSLYNNYTDDNIRSTVSRKLMMPVGGDNKNTAVLVASELQIIHREEIIDMLTAEFDATESCVYLEFCDAEYIDAHPLIGDDYDNISETTGPSWHLQQKPSCIVCELLVKEYEKKLSSNATESEIEHVMNKYCDKLKDKKYKNECHNFVNEYLPKIFALIQKDVPPKEFCTAIELCTSSLHTIPSDKCTECEVIVGAMEGALGDPKVTAWTTNEAMTFCNGLSEKYADVCFKFVEEIMPQIQGVLFNIPPWFLCSKMKSCVYGTTVLKSYDGICTNPERWCESNRTAFACGRMQHCNKTAWRKNEKSGVVKGPIF